MVKNKVREKVNTGAIKTVSLVGVDMRRGAGEQDDAPYGPGEHVRDDRRNVFTLLAFIAALVAFGILSFAMSKPEISQIENRPLEKAPDFSAASLFDGKFTDDFSRYYSDTFPWREWMITKASDFKSWFGVSGVAGDNVSIHYGIDTAGGQDDADTKDVSTNASDANDVSTGDTNTGDVSTDNTGTDTVSPGAAVTPTNDAVSAPEETTPVEKLEGEGKREGGVIVIGDTALEFYGFAEKNNARYANIINNFDKKYRGSVRTTALVAPTNIEFKLPDKYKNLTDDQRAAISFIYGKLNDDVVKVDVYDSLKNHANEYVYFRTDHHWTQLGAYYAYRDYCKALGLPHTPLLSYERIRLDGFLGSFYNSIGGNSEMKANPDYVLAYEPVVPYEMTGYENSQMENGFNLNIIRGPDEIQIANKYVALSGGDLPIIHIKMQSDTGRRLIIFKESFANAFIPFLTENYDEIIVVDFRYYEGNVDNLIAQYGINEALFLNYVSAAGSERQVDRLAALFK
jgi:hypothetical protein